MDFGRGLLGSLQEPKERKHMKYKIRYTPAAQKDMDDVWDGVLAASASYDIADKYVEEFTDKIAAKKDFPESGIPLYYRGLFTGFYSVNFKAYKAFYRINDGYIEVIRVLLVKMEYMKILFGESE
ncbi:MAG: type II toxin-antitoxin system RelE/ParE family toxin [Lachnospiraceae bacterium]|nr:type II toxin-antitoxin system RelE/ParE family toxin [Lachnospiraceae bacterium]